MKVTGWFTLCAAAAAVLMFTSPAMAQDASAETTAGKAMKGGDRGARANMFKIASELPGITDEQKQKIEAAQKSFREKLAAKQPAGEPGKEGGRAAWASPEARKMMTDARAELEAILTPEQKKEFEAKMPAMRQGDKKQHDKKENKTE